MTTLTLYHFTSRWVLPRLLREGITRGDVPVSPTEGYMAPWLTDDPSFTKQGWKSGSFLDKTEVRLTVKVEADKLQTWAQIVVKHNVNPVWAAAMVHSGGKPDGTTWYAHRGAIKAKQIVEWELRSDDLPPLDPMGIPEAFGKLKTAGTEKKPVTTKWAGESRSSFIHYTENWVRSPSMQYPWSDMPTGLLTTLSHADPPKAAEAGEAFCTKRGIDLTGGVPDNPRYADVNRRLPAMMTMSGVGRWLNSSRRSLIDISQQSTELLEVWEERFSGLPLVHKDPWRRGVMFRFSERGVMVYVEPMEGADAGIRYVMWSQDVHGRWGTVLPKELDDTPGMLDTYTDFDRLLRAKNRLAVAEDGSRIDLSQLRRVCINALAAIHEDPSVILGSRKAPRQNRSKKAGPVNKVRRLTLSYDGARLVTRRWIILPTEPQTVKIEHKPHASPIEHDVDPHYWRPWVNSLKAGEKILDTREKTRVRNGKSETYTQFRVKRWRGAADGTPFKRGKGVQPRHARVVTGVDDLSMPGSGA